MSIFSVFRWKCMSRIWVFGWENSVFLCIFCHGQEDVTAWLCPIPPKTNSGCNKQTHSKCFRWWRSNKSYSSQKGVISAFQWYMTSTRSNRRTPAISQYLNEVGTSSVATLTQPGLFRNTVVWDLSGHHLFTRQVRRGHHLFTRQVRQSPDKKWPFHSTWWQMTNGPCAACVFERACAPKFATLLLVEDLSWLLCYTFLPPFAIFFSIVFDV
jgi:hypothetical protein